MSNAVLLFPNERYSNSAFTGTVKDVTFLSGFVYGITHTGGGGSTTLGKVPLFGSTSNVTMDTALISVKSLTSDGTNLYAVTERGSAAAAADNTIAKITTAGVVTALNSAYLNMRSVIYDSVNTCLYISTPKDSKIVKATGGGIGGNADTFALTDFITGITDEPGRMWLNKGSTKLYFTTEANNKQIGAVGLSAGVASAPSYKAIGSGVGETTCLVYMDEFDAFIYADGTTGGNRGILLELDLFSMRSVLSADTEIAQGLLLNDNLFVYPDGTNLRYYDISYGSSSNTPSLYKTVTADTDTKLRILTGFSFAENDGGTPAEARVLLRNGVGGDIVFDIRLGASESKEIELDHPVKFPSGVYADVDGGTIRGAVFGR